MRTGNSDGFAVREWLAADADARTPKDPSLRDGVACDEIGCVARLADGAIVALPFAAEAFAEDCRRAALVVSQRTAPPSCAATAIDRTVWPRTGASGALSGGQRVGDGGGVSAGLRPAVGAGAAAARRRASSARRRRRRQSRQDRLPTRCNAARPEDSSRAGRIESRRAQYFRNSPTSLPCTRTRLGGRMRTS